jgi:hypothetical protein
MIIAPILLLSLPADYFDHAGSSISVFEWIGVSGHYSQGLTRGCMHLLHGDLQGAVAFNRLSIAVLPLIGGLWFWGLYGEITRYRRIYLKKDDSHGL